MAISEADEIVLPFPWESFLVTHSSRTITLAKKGNVIIGRKFSAVFSRGPESPFRRLVVRWLRWSDSSAIENGRVIVVNMESSFRHEKIVFCYRTKETSLVLCYATPEHNDHRKDRLTCDHAPSPLHFIVMKLLFINMTSAVTYMQFVQASTKPQGNC